MKKGPLLLLCFLFIGLSPHDEELTIVLTTRIALSNVSLLCLKGDTLVTTFEGNTIFPRPMA